MKISFTGFHRNVVFFCLLVLTLIILPFAHIIAGEQDKEFKNDYLLFKGALQLLNEKKYSEAEQIFQSLFIKENHRNNYYVLWNYAYFLKEKGDFIKAEKYYKKARELKPLLVLDGGYLIGIGEVFYQNGDYEKAKKYLENGSKQTNNEELKSKAENLLTKINVMIEDGN